MFGDRIRLEICELYLGIIGAWLPKFLIVRANQHRVMIIMVELLQIMQQPLGVSAGRSGNITRVDNDVAHGYSILEFMKRVIVSGYFNPLHIGHLTMIESAKAMGDQVIVIVNNDKQQVLKKGKVIINEQDRLRLVEALKAVDEVVLSIDTDRTVCETLHQIATRYPEDELVFGNGGDQTAGVIPETTVCEKNGIELVFGLAPIADSSTRINQALGREDS